MIRKKNAKILVKKFYILFFAFIFMSGNINAVNYPTASTSFREYHGSYLDNANDSAQENSPKPPEEPKKFEELKSLADEQSQQNENESEKKLLTIQNGLVIINYKQKQRATAIFEIPDKSKIYSLTEQEKEKAKEFFKVSSIENRGQYKIIHFHYKDEKLLPENKEQAIFLLYSPYIKNQETNNNSAIANEQQKDTLTELQKKALLASTLNKKIDQDDEKAFLTLQKKILNKENSSPEIEGLLSTTKVRTDQGLRDIGELKVGDQVACFDSQKSEAKYSSVTYIDKIHIYKHVQLRLDNDDILKLAHDHKFYSYSLNAWVTASELLHNPFLRDFLDFSIQDIKEVNEGLDVIRMTVDDQHNFFITNKNILVHNIAIEITVLFEIGEGIAITWQILQPTLYAIGTGLGYWLCQKIRPIPEIQTRLEPDPFYGPIYYQAEQNKTSDNREIKSPEKNIRAPGKPTEKDGYTPPKRWDGEKVKHPKTGQVGYPDDNGRVWVPTGPGSKAHGGPHWDVIDPNGKDYVNVYPGGTIRKGTKKIL